jgi:hypothetical protein
VTSNELKVVLFSVDCRWLGRVTGKGLREELLKVESLKLNEERKRPEEDNAASGSE